MALEASPGKFDADRAVRSIHKQFVVWELVIEAFKTWKKLSDAKEVARKSDDQTRSNRLEKLTWSAWQRFARRWKRAKSTAVG